MTTSKRRQLARRVASRFDRDYCVLVGRGTTGLTLVLDHLTEGGDVIFPSYTCQSAVYGAVFSKNNPVFADVRLSDYNMNIDTLNRSIDRNTEAVVPIHLFGHPIDTDRISDICEEYGATMVEDACHAVGSRYNGNKPGSEGKVSIVSFNESKPIDAGHGGAILTDDGQLANTLRESEKQLPTHDNEVIENIYEHYKNIFYSIRDYQREFSNGKQLFEQLPTLFRDLYIQGFNENWIDDINNALDNLEEEIQVRRRHATIYDSNITHPSVTHPDPSGQTSYYRYSVRLPSEECRDFVVSYLREREFHVSTLYYPIGNQFPVESDITTATRLSKETINLWVDSTVNEEYVRNCAEAVNQAVEVYESNYR